MLLVQRCRGFMCARNCKFVEQVLQLSLDCVQYLSAEDLSVHVSAIMEVADIAALLSELYTLYAPTNHLTLAKYRDLIRDSGLSGLKSQTVDLAFCSATRHSARMQLPAFVNSLPKLAAAKWPQSSEQEALQRLINDFLLPLRMKVCTEQREEETEAADIVKAHFDVLRDLYRTYFVWEDSEASEREICENSEAAFFAFLRECALSPQLLSRAEAVSFWHDLLASRDRLRDFSMRLLPSQTADEGRVFTLALFVASVLLLSESVPSLSRAQKVVNLLHRIQMSRRPAPSQESEAIDTLSLRLLPVFQRYCTFGDPMNTTHLGSSQFSKLFRHCQLGVDLDLVYSRFCPKHAKMDFPTFLKAIRVVASRAFPQCSPEAAVTMLAEQYLPCSDTQLPEAQHVARLGGLLQDPDVIEILSLIHGPVLYYYHYYADPSGLLSYPAFARFCKDFSLFPDVCSKSKLLSVFSALASIFSSTGQPEASLSKTRSMYSAVTACPDSPVIDEHLFLESLALIALELDLSSTPPPPQRLCLLVEKLNLSAGPQTVMKGLGHSRSNSEAQDLLAKLRGKYGHLLSLSPQKQQSLWELLQGQ